jgi:hypothetical protein
VNDLKTIARRLYARLFAGGNNRDKSVQSFTKQLVWFSSRMELFDEKQTWDNEMFVTEPILFWQNVAHWTPELSEFAIRLLSIPATAADSERMWSVLNSIHTPRRNKLTPENAMRMVTLKWRYSHDRNQIRRARGCASIVGRREYFNLFYSFLGIKII